MPAKVKRHAARGAALIMAIGAMVVLGAILAGLVSLGRFDIFSRHALLVTDSVFYVAESGIEAGINYLRNVEPGGGTVYWYNNAEADGTSKPRFTFALAPGEEVSVSSWYPATAVKSDFLTGASAIPVYSVEPFSRDGAISGSELFYVGIAADRVRISGMSSGANTLTVWPTDPVDSDHFQGETVYPVSDLTAALGPSTTKVTVQNTRGFLPDGTLRLYNIHTGEGEYIRYLGKTGTTFTHCRRGANGSIPLSPSAGEVTSGDWRVLPVDFEATIIATGTSGAAIKTLEVTVQYKNF